MSSINARKTWAVRQLIRFLLATAAFLPIIAAFQTQFGSRTAAEDFPHFPPPLFEASRGLGLPLAISLFIAALFFFLNRSNFRVWVSWLLILCSLNDVRPFGVSANRNVIGILRFVLVLGGTWGLFPSLRNYWRSLLSASTASVPTSTEKESIAKCLLLPGLLYFLCFVLITFPLISNFSTHFFADGGDGYLMVWNLWWVNKAVVGLSQSPWHTDWLFYPFGYAMYSTSFHPLKGFMAVPLLRVFNLAETYNCLLIFSFVMSGITTFLLAFRISGSYLGALVAGYLFTFSSYHFAHAIGHMDIVSLEWLPLYVLFFYLLIENPKIRYGIAAGFLSFFVLTCQFYAFLDCVLASTLILLWAWARRGSPTFLFRTPHRYPFFAFLAVAFLTSGIYLVTLFGSMASDSWVGAHNAREFSLDFPSLIIGGQFWRFAGLTRGYWSLIRGNVTESSVHLGVGIFLLVGYVTARRRDIARTTPLTPWFWMLIFFFVLALGPYLSIWGVETPLSLPYSLLNTLVPPLRTSGVPIRFVVMTVLGASLLCAFATRRLLEGKPAKKAFLIALLALAVVETLPGGMPTTTLEIAPYAIFLKSQPPGGVVDAWASESQSMYFQTAHEKPLAFGYVSRLPTRLSNEMIKMRKALKDGAFEVLRATYLVRYVVLRKDDSRVALLSPEKQIYRDNSARVFDLSL